jgi:hypothetical protein
LCGISVKQWNNNLLYGISIGATIPYHPRIRISIELMPRNRLPFRFKFLSHPVTIRKTVNNTTFLIWKAHLHNYILILNSFKAILKRSNEFIFCLDSLPIFYIIFQIKYVYVLFMAIVVLNLFCVSCFSYSAIQLTFINYCRNYP